jgi:hypothetical protein
MRVVVGHDVAVAGWVGEQIGAPMIPPYTALGFLDRSDRLAAGFVFYGCVPGGNVDMAVAARGLLTRGTLRAVAHYAFEQLGAARITCRPPASYDRAIGILKRVGFVQETVCKGWYGADNAVQLRILKRDARRWLP